MISVTTSVVDLCGAIGKECWVLVPKNAPWRYMKDGTYWYDVRTFRQEKEWPITEIASALSRF